MPLTNLPALVLALVVGLAVGGAGMHAMRPAPAEVPPDETPVLRQEIANLNTSLEGLRGQAVTAAARADELRNQIAIGKAHRDDIEAKLAAATDELAESRSQLAEAQAELSKLRGQLTVAESAKETLAAELSTAQQEAGSLRENLAFFEQLIPERSKPTGVAFRSVDISQDGNLLQYRVLVMRHNPTSDWFSGTLRFFASGVQDGSSATIQLESVASVPTSDIASDSTRNGEASSPATLRFRQYQRASGLLTIPPGFVPQTVTVQLLEGKSVRSEHTVKLAPKE